MYTVVDILSYAGCTNVDVALNYSMLAVTTVVSQLVTNHLGAPFLLAPLVTAGLLVFQVLLCVGVGCSGISVVWSAQAGYILVCYVAASNAPPNRLLRTAVAASSLLSLALGLYYFLTAEIITTVAHGCAAVLGSAVAAVAVYFLAPVPRPSPGYQTLADGPLSTPALEVKDSWIAGAGQGLFAAEAIPKGTVLCFYTGSTLGTKEAMRLPDKSYLMRLGGFTYVDARERPTCLARYINDCRNPLGHNVRFDKRPADRRANVVATRDIDKGEEIFADYGSWYWAGQAPTRLSLAQLLVLRGVA